MFRCQCGRYELGADFMESYFFHHLYQFFVGLAVGRKFAFRVEEIYFDLVSFFRHHAGDGEGVSAIIARSGKDGDRCFRIPSVGDGFSQCLCGTFH